MLPLSEDLPPLPLPLAAPDDLISPPVAPFNEEEQELARLLAGGFNYDHNIIAATGV
jgi:hypothetical protein